MKCISPLNLPRPNGKGERDRIIAPCGRCLFCLSNKRNQWSFRLEQELKICNSASFLTLTYNEENLPLTDPTEDWESGTSHNFQNTLSKKDLRLFMKRLRHTNLKQAIKRHPKVRTLADLIKIGENIRYYTVGEYGTLTDRPHYHSIMFNLQQSTINKLEEIWEKGQIHVAPVNSATIAYVTKYVIQRELEIPFSQRTKPFSQMSLRPGLGHNYLATKKYHQENAEYTVRTPQGSRQELPRYYKDKFFTKNQQKARVKLSRSISDENIRLEINRLIKLGHKFPVKYQIEQTVNTLNKLGKNATKNNKL